MTGAGYFIEHVVPNFLSHVTTTCAILRHHALAIGKKDYLCQQSKRPAAA